MTKAALNQETSPTKLGAIYNDQKTAESALAYLLSTGEITRAQIELIKPNSEPEAVDEKLAPEDHNIARTMVSTHLWFGIGGVLVGSLFALGMVLFGPVITRSSPLFTFIAFVFLCGVLGLLAAGLVSLRPDQDPLVMKTHTAHAHSQWTLIVHGHNHAEIDKAKAVLERSGGDITTTW